MKLFSAARIPFAIMVFALGLCTSCSLYRSATEVQGAQPQQAGVLYLYNKQNNQACSFIASDGQYAFKNSSGQRCPNDTIYTWRIYQGKPGTVITFKDSSDCNGNSEPSYSFLLTGPEGGFVTVPDNVYLNMQYTGPDHEDVISGVQTYSHGKTGTMAGKLSCVHIWQAYGK